MSPASIRLSRRSAEVLLICATANGVWHPGVAKAAAELKAALAPKPRKALPFSSIRKTRAAKKRSKKEEMAEIRARVQVRAQNHCECGCGLEFKGADWASYANEAELDHFFSRREPQTIRNCWMLTRACHAEKTENKPDASWWLIRFITHARSHGYSAEAAKAQARLESLRIREGMAFP